MMIEFMEGPVSAFVMWQVRVEDHNPMTVRCRVESIDTLAEFYLDDEDVLAFTDPLERDHPFVLLLQILHKIYC